MAEKTPKSIVEEDVGELLKERRGTYLVVNAVSKRVRQLQLGERPLVGVGEGQRDQIQTAIQEFQAGKVLVHPRVVAEEEEEEEEQAPVKRRSKK